MITRSSSSLVNQMQLFSFLSLSSIELTPSILHPVSNLKLDCGKAWKCSEDAGNVSVDHFQYTEGSSDTSDIFMCT